MIFKYSSKKRPSDGSVQQIYSVSNFYKLFLGTVNISQNIFSVEFLKDSSTKLMCIVLANPLNFDNASSLKTSEIENYQIRPIDYVFFRLFMRECYNLIIGIVF